jgi:hypothetical protein
MGDNQKLGWGGRRPGAGRPKGSRAGHAIYDSLTLREKYPLTPLEYMLRVINAEKGVTVRRRDEMARAAAPYFHPRLQAIDLNAVREPVQHSLDLTKLNDEELMQFERILAKAQVPLDMLDDDDQHEATPLLEYDDNKKQ